MKIDNYIIKFLKLSNYDRNILIKYYLGNEDPKNIKNNTIKNLYTSILLNTKLANDILSLIIKEINLEELELLSNNYKIERIENYYILINENIYYIFDINSISNIEERISIQSYIENKIKNISN